MLHRVALIVAAMGLAEAVTSVPIAQAHSAAIGEGLVATSTPVAIDQVLAAHERTVSLPGGITITFGFQDGAVHPVAPLNGMPTTRAAFLDGTAYAQVTGGTVNLQTGYQASCAADVNPMLDLNAQVGLGGSLNAGVYAEPGTTVVPNLDVNVGPLLNVGAGGDLSIAPGTEKDVVTDSGTVSPGPRMYFIDRNVAFKVEGCGGPLTVRPYVNVILGSTGASNALSPANLPSEEAGIVSRMMAAAGNSPAAVGGGGPAVHYTDSVYGDPFTL